MAVLLVVDPRRGAWVLYSYPDNGAYRQVLRGDFGEAVRLPDPLGVEIVTGGFPVYGRLPQAV